MKKKRAAQGRRKEEDAERKRETVLGLVAKGQVGWSARRIDSKGVASLDSPGVMDHLRTKYLARERPLPASVTKGQVVDSLAGLRESLLGLERGISPGSAA